MPLHSHTARLVYRTNQKHSTNTTACYHRCSCITRGGLIDLTHVYYRIHTTSILGRTHTQLTFSVCVDCNTDILHCIYKKNLLTSHSNTHTFYKNNNSNMMQNNVFATQVVLSTVFFQLGKRKLFTFSSFYAHSLYSFSTALYVTRPRKSKSIYFRLVFYLLARRAAWFSGFASLSLFSFSLVGRTLLNTHSPRIAFLNHFLTYFVGLPFFLVFFIRFIMMVWSLQKRSGRVTQFSRSHMFVTWFFWSLSQFSHSCILLVMHFQFNLPWYPLCCPPAYSLCVLSCSRHTHSCLSHRA